MAFKEWLSWVQIRSYAFAPTAQPKTVSDHLSAAATQQGDCVARNPFFMHTLQGVDPCHGNFAHHGVGGRREMETGSHIRVTSPVSPGGFQLLHSTATSTLEIAYQAPCLMRYNIPKLAVVMYAYVVPSMTGYCRAITKSMAQNSKPLPVKGLRALRFKVRGLFQRCLKFGAVFPAARC